MESLSELKKNILDFGESDKKDEIKYLDTGESTLVKQYNLPWIEKYRPDTFEDIVSHNDILNALENMISNNSLPHLIFYGPPGTGKTTTILACAKKMYGANFKNMTLELNGSEDRGINIVREQIKDFSVSKQFISNFSGDLKNNIKLVILDEADSMTYDAQFALRRMIENYTSNTRFCIICNYETKIISALKSRCMIFRFSPIPKEKHLLKLKNIALNESVNIDDVALKTIINLAEGDMRKSINLIQSIHTSLKTIKKIMINDVYKQIGYPTLDEKKNIISVILDKNINLCDSIVSIDKMKNQYGLTNTDILRDMINYFAKNIDSYQTFILTNIFDKLGDLECKMAISHNNNIMLANIINIIKQHLYNQ